MTDSINFSRKEQAAIRNLTQTINDNEHLLLNDLKAQWNRFYRVLGRQ